MTEREMTTQEAEQEYAEDLYRQESAKGPVQSLPKVVALGHCDIYRADGVAGTTYAVASTFNWRYHPEHVDAVLSALVHRYNVYADLLAVVEDMLSGLEYLRQTHQEPYALGIDRLEKTGRAAVAKVRGGA